MRCCWLKSQSVGIISALFDRLYIDHKTIQSNLYPELTSLPYLKIRKNLLWQSKYRFLSLTLNNYHNLIQSIFSISTCFIYLFVDSHLVVPLMEYSSYQASTTISFCHVSISPSPLMRGNTFSWPLIFLHFISHVSPPSIWLYYGLVSKFSSKKFVTIRLLGPGHILWFID